MRKEVTCLHIWAGNPGPWNVILELKARGLITSLMAVKLETVSSPFLLRYSLSEGAAREAGIRTETKAFVESLFSASQVLASWDNLASSWSVFSNYFSERQYFILAISLYHIDNLILFKNLIKYIT